MATIAGLIKKLMVNLEAVETELRFQRSALADPQQKGPLIMNQAGQPYPQLLQSYQQYWHDLDHLAKEEAKGRNTLMGELFHKGRTPEDAEIVSIKRQLATRHAELEQKLETLHRNQYAEFERALDGAQGLDFDKKEEILEKLKRAQHTQIEGLKERAIDDQKYVSEFCQTRMRADAAEHILRGLSDKPKAMGTPYRFGPFGAIKKLFLEKTKSDEAANYNEPEEVAIEIAKQSAISMERLKKDQQGQWHSKTEAEIDKIAELGARKVLEKNEIDWPELTSNYLEGRSTLTFTDAPSAGVFAPRGPMQLLQGLNLTGGGPLNINLNTSVKANAKKGIPAVEGAITCTIGFHITSSFGGLFLGGVPGPVIGTLNILAQTYAAKGWKKVELGYETAEEYWDEAYLACRRAGFAHEDIIFQGKQMAKPDVIAKGREAREKIEKVYKDKHGGPASTTIAISNALKKLSVPINNADPNLDPQRFFHVRANEERLNLFKKASLEQRAAILANSAFKETDLASFLNYQVNDDGQPPQLRAGMLPQEKATVLELMYEGRNSDPAFAGNPERAFEAYNALPDPNAKQAVFSDLNPQTQAYLLGRIPNPEAIGSFNAISHDERVKVLCQSHLPEASVYQLFKQLTDNQKKAVVKDLAKKPEGAKALGAIVARMFVDDTTYPGAEAAAISLAQGVNPSIQGQAACDTRDRAVVDQLREIMRQTADADQDRLMSAVHAALPSDRRDLNLAQPADNFSTMLARRDRNGGGTASMQHLYARVLPAPAAAAQLPKKVSDAIIKANTDVLTTPPVPNPNALPPLMPNLLGPVAPDRNSALTLFYDTLSPQTAANALLQSTPADRANQLNSLIAGAVDAPKQTKLVEIAEALGPNVVGKAFGSLNNDDLITWLIQASKGKFLADMLTVYYNQDTTDNNHVYVGVVNLGSVMPHLNHPELIGKMLAASQPAQICQLIQAINPPNPIQQAKIVRSLAEDKQQEVFNALPGAMQRQFFAYLKEGNQVLVLQALTVLLGQNNRAAAENPANQIIAYLNDPLITVYQKSVFYQMPQISNQIDRIIEHNSHPSADFLTRYLSAQQGNPALNQAFDKIMLLNGRFTGDDDEKAKQKAHYLNKFARALAQLPTEKQKALFEAKLASTNGNPDLDTVRKQCLIHLASEKNGMGKAKDLFNVVADGEKAALKGEIREFADGNPELDKSASLFRAELYEVIGMQLPAPPAQPPLGPRP